MILGICGRIGAGKETLTKFFRDKGFVYLESSQVLKEALRREGKEVTRKSMQDKGDELRKKYGVAAVMIMLLDKTRKDESKNYIFDSLRNVGEAEFLRKERNDFILIGVDASQRIRFERMLRRAKESDPKIWEDFLKVDERDNFDSSNPMGQQTGKLLEICDYVIVNSGSLKDSEKKVEEVWEKIENKEENYNGVIIEESLEDKKILKKLKIIKTEIEQVTEEHKTPWIKKWTLHTIEINAKDAEQIAKEISKSLDREHDWYADFKNKQFHFIIFRDKLFLVNRNNQEEYDSVKQYGISLGIPGYQLDFSPEIK